VQVASIFQTFGSRVQLFETGPRILATEDDDLSAAVAASFRQSGMVVREVLLASSVPGGCRLSFHNQNLVGCDIPLVARAI
jgi:pyruvate/2-oxoglutarate dehydrogenase complex dihydrolipoamide dehydrogenase (E3) component